MTNPSRDFRSLVVSRRDSCVNFKDKQAAKDRLEALRFYRGDSDGMAAYYGDSGDGMSSVVSRDTMEAIESMMPPLIRPFVAGEEVVSFEPIEKNDTEGASQATDYTNHVFRRHNNVLELVQTSLKDGLLFRLGVAKTVMEECDDGSPEDYEGLDLSQLQALQLSGAEIAGDVAQDPATGLYSVTVAPKRVKKFKVHIIAPEEFLYEERLASLDQATFLGHSKQITLAELIDMGIDEKRAKDLSSGRPESEDREDRHKGEDEPEFDSDDLARPVWVDECYIRCDYEKTGVLEWRKVLLGGSQSTILTNEKIDGHPYSVWTPIPIPHKLVGQSVHDLTRDIQMNKTAVQRETNNAMYLANRPQRAVITSMVNVDDLLNPTLDGIVRTTGPNAIEVLPSGGERIFGASFQMIEYLDGVREARTGVTRYNQGMDSNSLNKTATGMSIISNNSQQRQELVARQYGEFLKDIFERLYALIVQHADPADVARLRGKEFIEWPSDYDTNVSVGLGTNNKDQLVGHLMGLSQMMERIITLQQGINGPLVTAENVFEVMKRLPEAMGLKGDFFTDPAQAQLQQQEQPAEDPLAEPRLKAETEIAKEHIRNEGKVAVEQVRQQPQVIPFPEMGAM